MDKTLLFFSVNKSFTNRKTENTTKNREFDLQIIEKHRIETEHITIILDQK